MLPDHLTYEPTEYPYPFQYELQWNPDAPRIYYTVEYWHQMHESSRQRRELTNVDVENLQAERVKSTPFASGTKSGTCIICEKPFVNGQPDQITCARESCKAERQKQRVRKADQRRKERNRLAAMMAAADERRTA